MNFIYDPSLVLYVPLYEGDGASFASRDAYGHACAVTGARWRPSGHYFDGLDDLVDCGGSSAYAFNGSGLTLEVWFKTSERGTAKRLIGYDTPGNPRYLLMPYTSDVLQVFIHDGTGAIVLGATTDIADGGWHHGVFSYLCETGSIYTDGVLENSQAQALSAFSASGLYVGAYSYGAPAEHFQGLVGEVRIYNRGLTTPEVQHNYLATKWRYR